MNNNNQKCLFGVSLAADGEIHEIREGAFAADEAEVIAARLVLLAARIRQAALYRVIEE